MIGYLEGRILVADGKKATIGTKLGVGYEVNYGYYIEEGKEVSLYIHHHVSENDQSLWAFNNYEDKKIFELLKTVNKVGSSKAYPLISVVGKDEVLSAIKFEQVSVLTKAPGIGKKMAEQIILSLKDKLDKLEIKVIGTSSSSEIASSNNTNSKADSEIDMTLFNETMLALESLGYKDSSMGKLIQKNIALGVESSEELLKKVLREI